MKHTKLVALFMAIVMTMGLMTTAASAAESRFTYDEVMEQVWVCIEVDHELENMHHRNVKGYWRDYNAYGDAYITVVQSYIPQAIETAEEQIANNPDLEPYFSAKTVADFALGDASCDKTFRAEHPAILENFPTAVIKPETPSTPAETETPGNQSGYYSDDVDVNALSPEARDEYLKNHPEYDGPAPTKEPTVTFTDVDPDAWYAEAVYALAEGGLMAGIGNDKFNPEGILTYGEMATVLDRIFSNTNHATQPGDSHWAIRACEGMVNSRVLCGWGSQNATPDMPIQRQFAIASIQRLTGHMPEYAAREGILSYTGSGKNIAYEYAATGDKPMRRWNPDGVETDCYAAGLMEGYVDNKHIKYRLKQISEKEWTPSDIPDYDQISGFVQSEVVYAYNADITHGVDAAGTCDPTGYLTRAQLAQMLYNIGITQESSVKYVSYLSGFGG